MNSGHTAGTLLKDFFFLRSFGRALFLNGVMSSSEHCIHVSQCAPIVCPNLVG